MWGFKALLSHRKYSMEIDCKKCGEIKNTDCFYKSKRGRGFHVWCKECIKKYDHERHQNQRVKIIKQKKDRLIRQREWFNNYKKELKCSNCGESDICCLDFHHINPNEKEKAISEMISCSIDKIKEEINKCIVLCANCHRKLHNNGA